MVNKNQIEGNIDLKLFNSEKKVSYNLNPLVSIIISTYGNDIWSLQECLDSITEQDYKNVEIVVIERTGNEDVNTMLNFCKERDDRIKIVRVEPNCSFGYAKNQGLKEAKGELIFFVDENAKLLNNAILKCVFYLQKHKDCDCVYFKMSYFDSLVPVNTVCDGEEQNNNNKKQQIKNNDNCVENDEDDDGDSTQKIKYYKEEVSLPRKNKYFMEYPFIQNGCYRKELLDDLSFDEDIIFEDLVFSTKIHMKIKNVVLTNELFCENKNMYLREANCDWDKKFDIFEAYKRAKKEINNALIEGSYESYAPMYLLNQFLIYHTCYYIYGFDGWKYCDNKTKVKYAKAVSEIIKQYDCSYITSINTNIDNISFSFVAMLYLMDISSDDAIKIQLKLFNRKFNLKQNFEKLLKNVKNVSQQLSLLFKPLSFIKRKILAPFKKIIKWILKRIENIINIIKYFIVIIFSLIKIGFSNIKLKRLIKKYGKSN